MLERIVSATLERLRQEQQQHQRAEAERRLSQEGATDAG
jgi:hypothetical protein